MSFLILFWVCLCVCVYSCCFLPSLNSLCAKPLQLHLFATLWPVVHQAPLSIAAACILSLSRLPHYPSTEHMLLRRIHAFTRTHNVHTWNWKLLSWVQLFVTPWTKKIDGLLQARVLEWVAVSFSRGSSQLRDRAQVSCIAGDFLPAELPGKPRTMFTPAQTHMYTHKYPYDTCRSYVHVG